MLAARAPDLLEAAMSTVSADPTRIDLATDPLSQRMTGVTAHGFIPFDVPYLSEIVPGLWQGGCADGLVLPREVVHLVSLYPWESYRAKHELRSVLTVRMLDGLEEDMGLIRHVAEWVNACRRTGVTAVHCQAGLNRSSLVVASVLMLDGMTADAAISLIREKRSPACLCNPEFEAWLRGQGIGPQRERRGICGVCGRSVLVKTDGRLRHHRPEPALRQGCPGSGEVPGGRHA